MTPSSSTTTSCGQNAVATPSRRIDHDGHQQQQYHQQQEAIATSSSSQSSSFQDSMTLVDLLRRGHAMTIRSSPRTSTRTSAAKLSKIINEAIAIIDDDDDIFSTDGRTFLSQ